MSDYVEITLSKNATKYINKHLSNGHTLSKLVLNKVDLQSGRITTGMPQNALMEKVESFEYGGILPAVDKSEWRHLEEDKVQFVMRPIPRFFTFLIDAVNSFLQDNPDHICIFENADASPIDPVLKKYKSNIWTFETEVYHVISPKFPSISIELVVKESQSLWTFVGFLTSLPETLDFPHEKDSISIDLLTILADRTQQIIVGAYDGEGYIIWQSNSVMG